MPDKPFWPKTVTAEVRWPRLRGGTVTRSRSVRSRAPVELESHRRRARSLFRYGLDHLRLILLNIEAKIEEFLACLKVLSCT